jgi:plastocyanin domain-containing protein
MDTAAVVVLVVGVAAIAGVLWYFFGPRREVRAASAAGGVQEVRVTVRGGYSPDVVVVEKDRPVRLGFFRDETASCSEEVVFGDFGIARHLPAHQTTTIELTPHQAGEFTFTCGMNMLRGKLIVRETHEATHG